MCSVKLGFVIVKLALDWTQLKYPDTIYTAILWKIIYVLLKVLQFERYFYCSDWISRIFLAYWHYQTLKFLAFSFRLPITDRNINAKLR